MVRASIISALAIAGVSTFGDFIWATWIPRHRPLYGLIHGSTLFLCIGLALGILAHRPVIGAVGGALIGGLAAGCFYVLAPLTGYPIMFGLWFVVWVALGLLNSRINPERFEIRSAFFRGILAATASGLAFYAISGIWFPFDPHGWDYIEHFAGWTLAYFPGFAALLVARRPPDETYSRNQKISRTPN